MAFISSSNVSVFPSSLRGGTYSQGKFTTEENLTKYIKALADKPTYVIADPSGPEGPHKSTHYIFVINGFYFDVNADISNYKYATIRTDSAGRLVTFNGSTELDTGSGFEALHLSNTVPEYEPGVIYYTLDLQASDRYAKFTTDTFYMSEQQRSLTDVLNNKEDKFESSSSGHKLDLSNNLVINQLPVANGGTGESSLSDVTVGHANALTANAGDSTHAVYFTNGVPTQVNIVEAASKLGASAGSANMPVYFNNSGEATAIPEHNNVNIVAEGLQGAYGQKGTSGTTFSYTSVYFDNTQNGVPKAGITIYAIPSGGTQPSSAQEGDLLFVYNA